MGWTRLSRWLWGLLWLAIFACSYNPLYEGTRCGPQDECPPGYVCVGDGLYRWCTGQGPNDAGEEKPPDGGDPGVDGGDYADAGDPGADEGVDAGDAADGAAGDDAPICPDNDTDGHRAKECGGDDCDDQDPSVHPAHPEGPYPDPTCADGKDNDCDTLVDWADTPACERHWWDKNWTRRRKIAFDNRGQAENLANFPVLIRLDGGLIDYGQTQDQGQDLRFVDADGSTLLSYEIESWNEVGASFVWVKVPQIDGQSDLDHIWMYYGNGSAGPGQNRVDVWTEGYEAVYHLNDNLNDSTANGFHGQDQGTSNIAGQIANARWFEGLSRDFINLGGPRSILRAKSGYTLSAWIQLESLRNNEVNYVISVSIYSTSPTTNSRATLGLFGLQNSPHRIRMGGRSADTDAIQQLDSAGCTYTQQWHYLAGVVDLSQKTITTYLDGVQRAASGAMTGFSQGTTSDSDAYNSAIGSNDNGSSSFFSGTIDEVRISGRARSANWIKAQHLSMTNSFLVFYSVEVY